MNKMKMQDDKERKIGVVLLYCTNFNYTIMYRFNSKFRNKHFAS